LIFHKHFPIFTVYKKQFVQKMLHKGYGLVLATLTFVAIALSTMAVKVGMADPEPIVRSLDSMSYVVDSIGNELVAAQRQVAKVDTFTIEQAPPPPARPKNIILMIGDGMGITHITAATIANKNQLHLERLPVVGLMKTFSNQLITDSAASATAMATGKKTYNGAIAMDSKGNKLKTIVEIAEEKGLATGIVTTSSVTHATPASFYAHQPKRSRVNREVSAEFMTQKIEVLMGGGKRYFKSKHRKDERNLLKELEKKGYTVVDGVDEVGAKVPRKMVCLIADMQPKGYSRRGDFLPKATAKATRILDRDKDGFFMVVEGAQIDWGGHSRNSKFIINEMLDFDRSVGEALDFAEADGETLVIVTSDHETGGYSINEGSLKKGEVSAKFTDDYHTATMVPIYAYGPGAEAFSGTIDNTDIFFKSCELLGLEIPAEILEARKKSELEGLDATTELDSTDIMEAHGADFGTGYGRRFNKKSKE